VEALVETDESIRKTLDQERSAMQRVWPAPDTQIARMIDATAGTYADIHGIAGASLAGIETLELPGGVVRGVARGSYKARTGNEHKGC